MKFTRYPHVKKLLEYYVPDLDNDIVEEILKNGIKDENEAEAFSKSIKRYLLMNLITKTSIFAALLS